MTWTAKQKKAHSARMRQMWRDKRAYANADPQVDYSNFVQEEETMRANLLEQVTGIPALMLGPDLVNHPAHYTFSKYEVADVADEWYGTEPLLWNANKYMARWNKKGDPVENLEKAIWYLQRKINKLKGL